MQASGTQKHELPKTQPAAMIVLDGVSKSFGRFKAVDQLSLSIPAGEVFGFIGPNGAGKTTTIRMMGGILKPTVGSVFIGGLNMATDPEAAKRQIGFIPDRPYLYEKLTGMEFMQFTADFYSFDSRNFISRADRLLEQFSLADWRHELIESYSHGMRQRLIMAAALLHEPRVIIVDEPMVGLDPIAIKMVKDMFRDLGRQGVAVFMSTHTLAVAEDICDRIGIIRRGRLIATGTTADLQKVADIDDADLEQVFLSLTQTPDNSGKRLP
jgi:ABC-2 type transport system ATP-binding protein